VDAEHATDFEFTSWLRWNGVPFVGLPIWTFDNRCAVVNHALRHGVKLRIVTSPPANCLRNVSELFVFPEPPSQNDGGGDVVDSKPPDNAA
jgi:hypothetical protein